MKCILYILSLMIYTIGYAQAPDWQWALKPTAGGESNDAAESIVTDSEGNIIMTGSFQSETITFGSITLTNVNAPNQDLFLVKMNNSGTALWAVSAGGSQADYGLSLSIDPSGNILLGGYFKSTSVVFGVTTLTNAGTPFGEPFLVKYDGDGKVIWAKKGNNGTSSDAITSITTDHTGNIYATGPFQSDIITFGSTTLTNSGPPNQDLFLVKYNTSGNVLWAKSFGGSENEVGNTVSVDVNDNVFLGGQFESGSITIGSTTLTNDHFGTNDLFLAKYNPSGNVLWALSSGGTDSDYILSLSPDASGNMYVAGYFKSEFISFGSTTFYNDGSPFGDSFIAKFDGDGNILWGHTSINSESSDGATSIHADHFNNVYISGNFQSNSITFGSTSLSNTAPPNQDIYLAKYDSDGNSLWAISVGGDLNDVDKAVTCDANGNVYLAGIYTSNEITFSSTILTNSGFATNDLFLARIGSTEATNEGILQNKLALYPNPFTDQVILELDYAIPGITITINNAIGQPVMQVPKFSGQKLILNRNQLPAGVYFINLSKGNQILAVKKIIICD